MGQIIAFPVGQTGRSNTVAADRQGEVLIFTGIRIERHDEADIAPEAATSAPTRTGT